VEEESTEAEEASPVASARALAGSNRWKLTTSPSPLFELPPVKSTFERATKLHKIYL
jgi:hypothetical protein